MKIIFANRRDCFTSVGGDTIQMLKTKEYLEKKMNIQINICTSPEEIMHDKESKIVHIFNLQTITETNSYIDVCRKEGKKVVLSTIYWDMTHAIFAYKFFNLFQTLKYSKYFLPLKNIIIYALSIFGRLKTGKVELFTNNYISERQYALNNADILLPNSIEEFSILCKDFKIKGEILENKTVIVPNAVDIEEPRVSASVKLLGDIRNYVLEVGRIEVNKNQISVVEALMDNPEIPIVFIGRVANELYYKKLLEISNKRGNVYFINETSQEEVFEFYKKAKVHVLPSFRESPGLSSLEALYFKCEIVTSSDKYCPINYYRFREKAHLCDPYNINSIRDAVLKAYNSPVIKKADEEYFNNFSYENVADIMYGVYSKIYMEVLN